MDVIEHRLVIFVPIFVFFVGKSLGFGSYSLSGMQVLVNITENQKEKPQLILNEKS